MAAAVLVAVAAAGCAGEPQGSGTSRSTTPTTTTASSTTSSSAAPAPAARTLAELAEQPCRALAEEDTAALGMFIEGSETDYGGKGCQWGLQGGLVNFVPSTAADLTADPRYQHLTQQQVGGRAALAGADERGGCVLIVSVGTNQSFTVIAAPFGQGAPGPDACTLATTTATAIAANLS